MKNDKENNQEVNIETNNDAVLYSVMLRFLKKRCKTNNCRLDNLYIRIDERMECIDVFSDLGDRDDLDYIEAVKIN